VNHRPHTNDSSHLACRLSNFTLQTSNFKLLLA
jgi:hypothetical protein